MKKVAFPLFFTVVTIIIIISIIYGLFWLERKIHYKLGYQSMVEQTVKNMVKQECLKEPK